MARRNANLTRYVKKQAHTARKMCGMNVFTEKNNNFANKVCRVFLRAIVLQNS